MKSGTGALRPLTEPAVRGNVAGSAVRQIGYRATMNKRSLRVRMADSRRPIAGTCARLFDCEGRDYRTGGKCYYQPEQVVTIFCGPFLAGATFSRGRRLVMHGRHSGREGGP